MGFYFLCLSGQVRGLGYEGRDDLHAAVERTGYRTPSYLFSTFKAALALLVRRR